MEVKLKFQDKFYDIIDHNKCPSSEKSAKKCILRKSYFHHSEPTYNNMGWKLLALLIVKSENSAKYTKYVKST